MDPLRQAIEDCKDKTPDSVSPHWKPNGTGFRSEDNMTKTRDVSVTWVTVPSRMLYLVVDEGNTYKPYLDRYFIFADADDAIEKVRILCQADPLIGSLHGEKITPSALTPEMLKPGTRFVFQKDYIEVYIIAVPLSAYNVGSFSVGVQR